MYQAMGMFDERLFKVYIKTHVIEKNDYNINITYHIISRVISFFIPVWISLDWAQTEISSKWQGRRLGLLGGAVAPPKVRLAPPKDRSAPPPPHSPVWVFSFEKLRKSVIQYKHIDKKNNDYEKNSKLKKIYIKFDEKIKSK